MSALNKADPSVRRAALFTTIWTFAILVLISVTWRLWTGVSNFPQVPLLEAFISTPLWVDWLALAALVASTVWLLLQAVLKALRLSTNASKFPERNWSQIARFIFLATLLCLFFLNQHRLQPWAWQFFLYAALATLLSDSYSIIFSSRWLTASIYFYSAMSKFDYQFFHGLGGRLADTLTSAIGLQIAGESNMVAFAMPVFELLIAVALLIPKIRKLGVIMAATFHLALIATLGPWGLDHHFGVLVWNFFFFLLTATLFWPTHNDQMVDRKSERRLMPIIISIVLVAYPIMPRVDHWLAWGLYSPNNSRCDLEVIQENDDGEIVFERFDFGSLSLEQLNVPLYPDARFQLGVALAIQKQQDLKRSKISIRGKSDRFTGERESIVFEDNGRWGRTNKLFIFNSKPREF